MKKIILFLAFVAFFYAFAFSQKPGFGFSVGPTLSCMKYKYDDGYTYKGKMRPGFTIGAFADVNLASSIRFRPELNYTMKAIKFKDSNGSYEEEEKQTLNYIEAILDFVYGMECGCGRFFAGLGPGVGYGLGGKYKYKSSYYGNEDGNITFGNDENEDHYKPLQVSGNVVVGFQLKNGFLGQLSFNAGINNIAIESDAKARGNYGALKLGFSF
jgi:Outer membrane protein beta-barrel domain